MIAAWHRSCETSRRLDEIPGVGPAEVTPNCFIVRDANGQQLAYVYFEDEPGDVRQPNCLARMRREGLR
jgi:hypothetical protein